METVHKHGKVELTPSVTEKLEINWLHQVRQGEIWAISAAEWLNQCKSTGVKCYKNSSQQQVVKKVRPWKPPRREATSLQTSCSFVWLSSSWRNFSSHPVGTSLVSTCAQLASSCRVRSNHSASFFSMTLPCVQAAIRCPEEFSVLIKDQSHAKKIPS